MLNSYKQATLLLVQSGIYLSIAFLLYLHVPHLSCCCMYVQVTYVAHISHQHLHHDHLDKSHTSQFPDW